MVQFTNRHGETFRNEAYGMVAIAPKEISVREEYQGIRTLSLLTCKAGGRGCLLVRYRMI